jgi:hypothetical protein
VLSTASGFDPHAEAGSRAGSVDHGDPDAARALLAGADAGESDAAEAATGFLFGDPRLVTEMRELLDEARRLGHDRMEQLAERFLRRAGVEVE